MPAEPVETVYERRLAELRASAAELEQRGARISALRGVTFLIAVGLAGYGVFRWLPAAGWALAGAAFVAFVALVVRHALLITRAAAFELRASVVARGLARCREETRELPDRGERFAVAGHGYARDLDILGQGSLFQMLSTARTPGAEALLASWLLGPATAEIVAARQEAARELAERDRFREDIALLALEAQRGPPREPREEGVDPVIAWTATPPERVPRVPAAVALAGKVLVPITLALLVIPQVSEGLLPGPLRWSWLIGALAQLALLGAAREAIQATVGMVSSRQAPFGRYRGLFERIEDEKLGAPRSTELAAELRGSSGHDASQAMRSLERIVGYAELRHNAIIYFVVNTLVMWDLWVARALTRWHERSGVRVRRWLDVTAEIEALAPLGGLARERPTWCWPQVGGDRPRVAATALGHPLLPAARRVSNDVALGDDGLDPGSRAERPPPEALMITGSNMSGKSTMLRSIGINAVLALAGAPVCAEKLETSVLAVRTSMRLEDSLEHGVSHFYAEIERLKMVVDTSQAGGDPVLFLLDEVLHGTNSRERRIGAKAVVKHLLARGAIGGVSSHDLGLAALEEETGGRVRNVHFEELVSDDRMTFDYKLKQGPVTTANALRLMKLVGLDVEVSD
ncbi:MAG: MutS family DNA mismatch repair protein [Polyangiaceae bacterium]